VLLCTPPLLLVSTLAAFHWFAALLAARRGYFAGFLFYWLFWCLVVPVALLGWPRVRALGLGWGFVARRTGSILWTMSAHILFDFSGLGARLYVGNS